MQYTREEKIALAAEYRAESEKLAALLLLPEVASDRKLAAHYTRRIRLLSPVVEALALVEEKPDEHRVSALEREILLLSVAEKGDSLACAGAGICVRVLNKDDRGFDAILARLSSLMPRSAFTLVESGADTFRAECRDLRAYAVLSALGQGALGEGAVFSVYPILPPPEVREEDVRTDIFLNGGKGGQNVNKVETAVRMIHLPTGVTVTCRDERSQLQNKKRAARLLKERVAEHAQATQLALVDKAKREIKG